jgi:hypothetical protein
VDKLYFFQILYTYIIYIYIYIYINTSVTFHNMSKKLSDKILVTNEVNDM